MNEVPVANKPNLTRDVCFIANVDGFPGFDFRHLPTNSKPRRQ